MIRWLFAADNQALRTEVGTRDGHRIRVARTVPAGLALGGPGVDVPAGDLVARVLLEGPSRGVVRMEITADGGGRTLAMEHVALGRGADLVLELGARLAEDARDVEVRLFCRGLVQADIAAVELNLARAAPADPPDPARHVGFESRKSYARLIESGFVERYLSGPAVLEVGYKGYEGGTVPIVPQAVGLDVGYPGYDGTHFPFADDSLDAIYSSHCFEHIDPWKEVLQDWHRILKPGGFLVIVVPHQFLFERRRWLPSPINIDHKRFYTSASLLAEIEAAFVPNTFRVRHLAENDRGFDYDLLPYHPTHGAYEIELVVEKLARPFWNLDDDSVRPYAASEFFSPGRNFRDEGADPWSIELDLVIPNACAVWGPYVGLGRGSYEVEFFFDLSADDRQVRPEMRVDVAEFGNIVADQRIEHDVKERFYDTGRVTVPFDSDKDQGVFEFRVYAPGITSPARPRFRGAVVRYRR